MNGVAKEMSRKSSGPDIEGLKKFASPVSTVDRGGTPFFLREGIKRLKMSS